MTCTLKQLQEDFLIFVSLNKNDFTCANGSTLPGEEEQIRSFTVQLSLAYFGDMPNDFTTKKVRNPDTCFRHGKKKKENNKGENVVHYTFSIIFCTLTSEKERLKASSTITSLPTCTITKPFTVTKFLSDL